MITVADDGTRNLACPLRLSGSSIPEDKRAPGLGEHTGEVLSRLGIDSEQLKSLSAQGVI
jgi:crotonobetainyl-CoA:carnitine CoA-transferase CaiB-like acyl-CoA transferase